MLNKDIRDYRTTKIEAEKAARNLCEKYGYDTKKYDKVRITNNLETECDSYIWYVDFYKEYDGITNTYESINVGFIPEINQLFYLNINNFEYGNNPVEITEEQAKQTVLEVEQKINTDFEIKDVSASLAIDKMNGDAYKRITDYEQYYKEKHIKDYPSQNIVYYRTNSSIRKIWKVTIGYNIPQSINLFVEPYSPFDRYYTYYVDATTGEIIGGCPFKIDYN